MLIVGVRHLFVKRPRSCKVINFPPHHTGAQLSVRVALGRPDGQSSDCPVTVPRSCKRVPPINGKILSSNITRKEFGKLIEALSLFLSP